MEGANKINVKVFCFVLIFIVCLTLILNFDLNIKGSMREVSIFHKISTFVEMAGRTYNVRKECIRCLKIELINTVKVENAFEERANVSSLATTVLPTVNTIISKSNCDPNLRGRYIFSELRDIDKSDKNIFFVETSCGTKLLYSKFNHSDTLRLDPRQSCSVESAALLNPARDVYICYTCPLSDDFLSYLQPYMERLLELPNVHVVRMNLTQVFQDSPVHQLFESGRMESSLYPVEHASDVLRYLLLWKFGGFYSDLDVINIRPLHQLGMNFASFATSDTIANGILHFKPQGFGHRLLTEILSYVNAHFDGQAWAAQGPSLVTRVVQDQCNSTKGDDEDCDHELLTLYDPSFLLPVHWSNSRTLFNATEGEDIVQRVKKKSFSVHFYSSQTRGLNVTVGSTQAYALLAKEFCPGVYRNCGLYF